MPRGFRGALLNSATPWATSKEQLTDLYQSPYTAAVTIRTSLLSGWPHDDAIHKWTFYDARVNVAVPERSPNGNSSFNTMGYSPTPLPEYLDMVEQIVTESGAAAAKPFVVSVTGTPEEVLQCRRLIAEHAQKTSIPLLMEINLSCPNIANMPPPAYSGESLRAYLMVLQQQDDASAAVDIPVGIKTTPYTHHDQFRAVVDALADTTVNGNPCPVSFITATNTLGSCLLLDEPSDGPWKSTLPSASSSGLGGVGGTALHALSLGNVRILRGLLDQHEKLKGIEIIGVGGVNDFLGFNRMKSAGASAVAIGTAYGREGIDLFHKIATELRNAAHSDG